MRHVHLNKYERVAGLFILVAIGGAMLSALSVAIKQGWFEPRISFQTTFENADGVHAGTGVKMAGLNAGSVDEVDLLPNNQVRVKFHIIGKFRDRIHGDSKALLIRPFIIGDRVLEVTVGDEAQPLLEEHASLVSEETMDLMTLISGKKMGHAMTHLTMVAENLETVLDAFSKKDRMESIIRMFDNLEPLISSLNIMSTEVTKLSRQATKDENLSKVMSQVTTLTRELNVIVPALNKENPEMGRDVAMLTRSLGHVTATLNSAFAQTGTDAPTAAKRAMEALNEATVLIKAMQKSFFVRSSVREVRDEEAAAPAAAVRNPAPSAPAERVPASK